MYKNIKFGTFIRKRRQQTGISMREMARKTHISPTFLCQVERNECKPPAEEKIIAIASFLQINPDQLLAIAGRVNTDVLTIIKKHPVEMSYLIRGINHLSQEQILQQITKMKQYAQKTRTG